MDGARTIFWFLEIRDTKLVLLDPITSKLVTQSCNTSLMFCIDKWHNHKCSCYEITPQAISYSIKAVSLFESGPWEDGGIMYHDCWWNMLFTKGKGYCLCSIYCDIFPVNSKTTSQISTLLTCMHLTHWGRVTHICVSRLTIIGSDNGLSPNRRQAVIWTSDTILLIGPLRTNFSEIFIEIYTFSFRKCIWKCCLVNGGHFVSASMC